MADLSHVVLRPVRGHHAFEACVEQLATAIRLGVFPLGGALPNERDLAERLSVSRATLREAMAALREAGLVKTVRGRSGGTVVILKPKSPTGRMTGHIDAAQRQAWLDSLDFRRIVEAGAAWLLASKDLDREQVATLEAAHESVATARTKPEHRQADSLFHLTIASLTGSASLVEAVTKVQATLHEMLSAIPVLSKNIDHSDRQHAEIVRAVLERDPARARRVMEAHCDDTSALLRGLLT
jgi:GntR family transcriptional repressor for pyruvate dehydrogenase complex